MPNTHISNVPSMYVSIGNVSKLFGVTTQTIRNWAKRGFVNEYRTAGGHRRFSLEEVEKVRTKLNKIGRASCRERV